MYQTNQEGENAYFSRSGLVHSFSSRSDHIAQHLEVSKALFILVKKNNFVFLKKIKATLHQGYDIWE